MNLQELLNKWNIKCDVNTVLSMWNESHRSYHTLNHLNDLIDQINENKYTFTDIQYEKLILTALFHDCVYDPMKQDNEEKSAEFFLKCCEDKTNRDIQDIYQIILDTKTHKPSNRLSSNFIQFDMNVITNGTFEELLDWEKGIAEEYKGYGNEAYKEGRIKFLESLLDKHPYIYNSDNLSDLIEYVKTNY
jgi:pantetheine-phosphate adenylyltransferase